MLTPERALSLIARSWGKRSGYVFFPWIEGKAKTRGERVKGYHEGPAFLWPGERDRVVRHMRAHGEDDLYFCPVLFEGPHRVEHLARDERALWADLDAVDPEEIGQRYRPTIAWQTSPKRYQALWILSGVIQGASWAGKENHRLTTYLGADPSGWDTTQLLRIPGWRNHKYDDTPRGRLLWSDGPRYSVLAFDTLPEVDAPDAEAILDDEIEAIDRHEVWARVRLKVSSEVRQLVRARVSAGDRSAKLWQIERELADAGCTAAEIVAVARETVWNKFAGRADELKRLKAEAAKAVAARPAERQAKVDQERGTRPDPVPLFPFFQTYQEPEWLVKDIWMKGTCGFIAGQPKSHKTWMAMDLAFSVATGTPFLGYFDIRESGRVLLIQEEDSIGMLKVRSEKIWRERIRSAWEVRDGAVYARQVGTKIEADDVMLDFFNSHALDPGHGGFVISDEAWQSWLAEQVEKRQYVLIVLDPLMMMTGEVEEFKSTAMTEQIYKPLRTVAREYGCAVCVVHHMRKSSREDRDVRGGQMMLGSVANHAWSDNSLYVTHTKTGQIRVERESKDAAVAPFELQLVPGRWAPAVVMDALEDPQSDRPERLSNRRYSPIRKKVLQILADADHPLPAIEIAERVNRPYQTVYQHLLRLRRHELIRKEKGLWVGV